MMKENDEDFSIFSQNQIVNSQVDKSQVSQNQVSQNNPKIYDNIKTPGYNEPLNEKYHDFININNDSNDSEENVNADEYNPNEKKIFDNIRESNRIECKINNLSEISLHNSFKKSNNEGKPTDKEIVVSNLSELKIELKKKIDEKIAKGLIPIFLKSSIYPTSSFYVKKDITVYSLMEEYKKKVDAPDDFDLVFSLRGKPLNYQNTMEDIKIKNFDIILVTLKEKIGLTYEPDFKIFGNALKEA